MYVCTYVCVVVTTHIYTYVYTYIYPYMFFLKSPSNLDTLLNNNNTLYARPGKMQLINPRFSLQKKKQLTIWNDSRMTVTFFINYILWEHSVTQHPSSILSLAWTRPTSSIYLRSWKENPFKQFPFHFICKESGYTLIIFGSRISLDNFLDRVLIFKFLPSNKISWVITRSLCTPHWDTFGSLNR